MNGNGTFGLVAMAGLIVGACGVEKRDNHRRRPAMFSPLRLPLLISALTLSVACADSERLTDPVSLDGPAFAIADAARGFKHGFYWLPPMVKNPVTSGTFDAELSPVVEICALDGDACDPSLALIETFLMDGSGSTGIRLSEDHYIVNWHLGDYDLTAATHYRISVFAGPGVLVGYADVEPVSNGSEMKNVDTGEYIALVDGRTLPIKFRIETGMVASVSVTPGQASIAPGETQQFTATVTDLHGNTLPLPVDWTSDNASVASVDGNGLATGMGPGSTTITATLDHENASATLTVEAAGGAWAQISAGDQHTCGVTTSGEAFCWGRGAFGRLGNGGTADHLLPVAVAGNHRFASIDAGASHTCGLTTGGEAFCWGGDSFSQLGNSSPDDQLLPVAVAGNHQFASISAGFYHTCGVTTDGEGFCWGYGSTGRLGNGTFDDQLLPVAVTGNHQFASISAGLQQGCGVTLNGDGLCWGDSDGGLLGYGQGGALEPSPVMVAGNHQFTSISASTSTCAVDAGGEAFCWGPGFGNGRTPPGSFSSPVAVGGSHQFASISAGYTHTCGLTTDGDGICWGAGNHGELGYGGTAHHFDSPVAVAGNHPFAAISAGSFFTCGVTTDGEAFCWGLGDLGQLGNGGTTNQLVPVQVSDPF